MLRRQSVKGLFLRAGFLATLIAVFGAQAGAADAVFADLLRQDSLCAGSFARMVGGLPERKLNPEFLKKHTRHMTREVPQQTAVENQDCLGVCHLYALYSDLGQELPGGKDRDAMLSPLPWVYEHWKNRAIEVALDPGREINVNEGGFFKNSFQTIQKVGAIPKSVWREIGGKEDVATKLEKMVESRFLENLLMNLKTERGMLLDLLTDRSASVSDEATLKLRKQGRLSPDALIAAKTIPLERVNELIRGKREALRQGMTALSEKQIRVLEDAARQINMGRKVTQEELDSIRRALQQDIQQEVTRLFNRIFFDSPNQGLPQKFKWNDKEYTPQSFAAEFLPAIRQKVVTVVRSPARQGKPVLHGASPVGDVTLEAPLDQFSRMIRSKIDAGDNVWLGYDHDRYFVDDPSGIMSVKAFRGSEGSYEPRWKRKNLFQKSYGMHAVEVVGYEQDASGKIIKWKIKNSWGRKTGDQGYYYMYDDYFRAYAEMISFRDERGEFSRFMQKKAGSQPKKGSSLKASE